ncbi:MAG: energy-coupled thiamine transporter ThiT [Peptostreptococcaceae bacterium]|nr:energy-coupled thiamine transporter ThiT [Peptostreptococcaceae bacterium]
MFGNLQDFFTSTTGITITVLLIITILFFILRGGKNDDKRNNTKVLTISALLIALAMVLGEIKIFQMPQGGSITLLSMLPIVFCGYLFGVRRGVMAGICVGLLNLIFGPYIIHPLQMLLDYPIAFGAMGLAGLSKKSLTKGYLIGISGRFVCAVISGIVFFGEYAPEGFNAVSWSIWYNLTYISIEAVITIIIINIKPVKNALERLKNSI